MDFFEAEAFTDIHFDDVAPAKKSIFDVLEEPTIVPMRQDFPAAGEEYAGGASDGYVYTSVFKGANLAASYQMVQEFLREEGYGELPLPKDAEELSKFRLATRNRQILMFEDNGYVHNPIKILFPTDGRQKRTLILEIYNEAAENHLLRFHRRGEEE